MKVTFLNTAIFFSILLLIPNSNVFAFPENSGDLNLVIGETKEVVSSKEISQWMEVKTFLMSDKEANAEIENIYYCSSDPVFCRLTKTYRGRFHLVKKSTSIVKEELMRSFLEDLARKINKDPVNAKFSIENGKVTAFSLSKNGIALDIDASTKILTDFISKNNYSGKEINLSYKNIESEVKSENIDTLGIDTLIGEGKSNFKGSPKNRIYNIGVATSRFNGILIKPGEEFSFVGALGEVDEEHGYKAELVIKRDKTEPEFGGGICQVSTTAFRAAIYSGLKITARRNHAYPVSYYNPQGMDATVYIPRPDLRFINDTPGYILIQTKIEGTELTFQFYGTNDGRKTEVTGPRILERNSDGSMKTTFTQKVYDKDNKVLIDDVFNSSYDSPSKYPHPGDVFTEKPNDWSKKQWQDYKKQHNLQ